MIVAQQKEYENYNLPQKRNNLLPSSKAMQTRKTKRALMGVVFLIFVVAILISFCHFKVVATGHRIYVLEQEMQVSEQELMQMEERVSTLTSLEVIEGIAINKLGMVHPDDEDVIKLETDNLTTEDVNENLLAENEASTTAETKERNPILKGLSNLLGAIKS